MFYCAIGCAITFLRKTPCIFERAVRRNPAPSGAGVGELLKRGERRL
jgi:hypothetical protein